LEFTEKRDAEVTQHKVLFKVHKTHPHEVFIKNQVKLKILIFGICRYYLVSSNIYYRYFIHACKGLYSEVICFFLNMNFKIIINKTKF